MKPDEAEEYTQALGQVVAGGWRQISLGQRLGVPQALKLSVDQWVKQRLGGYVKYSVEERQQAVQTLADEGHSERSIKRVLGVSRPTIRKDLKRGKKLTSDKASTPSKARGNGQNLTIDNPLDVIAGIAVSDEARAAADREAGRQEMQRQRAKVRDERVAPPLPAGTYRLIYADPPWRYEHVKTESRAVENQYPTMDLADICAMEVPAAKDAVLFLWATSPKLTEALQVLAAWGFEYRTCAVWDKEQIGMGYYFRQQHELLLVGARGNAPVPEASTRLPSVFRSKRSEHSEKPTFVYGYLESMYPAFTDADRAELFSRDRRPGWTSWSNEPAEAV